MSDLDIERVLARNPCGEAREWLARQAGNADTAWQRCSRGDWLLWLALRIGDRQLATLAVLAAADCAEAALVRVPAGEDRPRLAIETSRRWARGEVDIAEVKAAAAAADAVAARSIFAAADAIAAADAAEAAAYAAYAAGAAHATAAFAARTAHATYAPYATVGAHAAACTDRALGRSVSAAIVRRRIAWRVVRDALRRTP